VIRAERREGTIEPPVDRRAGYAPFWLYLDRNVPLAAKLAIPLIGVTLVGTVLFGYLIADQIRTTTESSVQVGALSRAHSGASDFVESIGQPQAINGRLHDEIADDPGVVGIWIVDLTAPGSPAVASSHSTDVGRTDVLVPQESKAVLAGATLDSRETIDGQPTLETVLPMSGGRFAVVVNTSLRGEDESILQALLWIVAVGVATGALEVAALTTILEWGVLRRIRRVNALIGRFGRDAKPLRLSEGQEPRGRDMLFNLARDVDTRLAELGERERAGDVLSDLGRLALQGARPADLTQRALELTRKAAELERCFLVETGGTTVMVNSSRSESGVTSQSTLPVWLGALVRSAARARRAVLTDEMGEDCRFWDAGSADHAAVAAFVPLAGTPDPIGVIVGIAGPGSHVTPAAVALMEGVAASLGESLQRTQADKASQESEVKSKALATVSHEMRNPLNAMLGFSNLLLTGAAGPLTEKQESYVRHLDDASHHLLTLVNDYLDLARIIAGSLPMHIESVAVLQEVKRVVDLMGPTAAAKKVALRSDVPIEAVARVDRTRLRQILVNLLSNAVKFTPAGGYVRVEAAGGSNGVRISVIDTGIGIPADRQHLIFTEFAELRPGQTGTGSGLGLALTKRFVEGMGGFIRFTSSEGAGTIFDVWLPGDQTPLTSYEAPDTNAALRATYAASAKPAVRLTPST
jgi:signal transduction histidine kinase